MTHRRLIQADASTLLRQAAMTASEYLREAISSIDGQLGEGYAKKNPQLIAAFMNAAAADFHSGITGSSTEALADAVLDVASAFGSNNDIGHMSATQPKMAGPKGHKLSVDQRNNLEGNKWVIDETGDELVIISRKDGSTATGYAAVLVGRWYSHEAPH